MSGGFGSNNIMQPQRMMQYMSLKKTGGGTPALGGSDRFFNSIVDNGPGDYTINFVKKPFAQVPEVQITPKAAGFCIVTAASNTSITIECFDVDGTTPAELDFDVLIIGSLANDLIG